MLEKIVSVEPSLIKYFPEHGRCQTKVYPLRVVLSSIGLKGDPALSQALRPGQNFWLAINDPLELRLDELKVDLSFKVPDVCNEKLGLEGEHYRLKHDSGFKNGLIPFLKRVLIMAAMH